MIVTSDDRTTADFTPWPAALASLIAYATLQILQKPVLPMFIPGIVLLCSYFFRARARARSPLFWMFRLILYGVVASSTRAPLGSALVGRMLAIAGPIAAIELALQCWSQSGERRPNPAPILLSGLMMIAAANTTDDQVLRLATPLYSLCLVLALPYYASNGWWKSGAKRNISLHLAAGLAILGALFMGALFNREMRLHRYAITRWAADLILPDIPNREYTGLSALPVLGHSFNYRGLHDRVLIIEGNLGNPHLRAAAFETYRNGGWEPSRSERPMVVASVSDMQPVRLDSPSVFVRIYDDDHLLLLPLDCAGFQPLPASRIEWDRLREGPVRGWLAGANSYRYAVGAARDADHQGPLCPSLDPSLRRRCLAIPTEIDPAVCALGRRITAGLADDWSRIHAVVRYLQLHHAYSLYCTPGPGDPVSGFLLREQKGHCQYFASSAAILLRVAGIPTRYANGYYASEHPERGVTIVREEDAHAWTECWIKGAGWVTVDATPSGGLPDHTRTPAPYWRKAWELLQDRAERLWSSLSHADLAQWSRIFAGIGIAIILVLQGLPALRRRNQRTIAGQSGYSSGGKDLTGIAAEYESLLAAAGAAVPDSWTWSEHAASLEESTHLPNLDLAALRRFVANYNNLRFGGNFKASSIESLRENLRQISVQR